MRAVCYIQARGGSKRIPKKNLLLWQGRTMVEDSISKAQKTGLFDIICVTSDCREILEKTRNMHAIPIFRSDEASCDSATDDDVAFETLPYFKNYDYICKLYPCIPLLDPKDIVDMFYYMNTHDLDAMMSTDIDGEDAGAVYWFKMLAYKKAGRLSMIPWALYSLPPQRCQDINTMDDIERAMRANILP